MKFNDFLKDELDINVTNNNYLAQAFIHPSYANEINKVHMNYERLEFMGDAIMQFLVSEYIFNKYPEIDEGKLTVLRAKAVREESLANYAQEYKMANYIKVGKGEKKAKGNTKVSVLANVFEAVLGAIYLSNGIEDASKFLKIVYKTIEKGSFEDLEDYKTKLQEYVQADAKRTVTYELINTAGSANAPVFTFKVLMDDLVLGIGQGTSKKKAQQNAAKDALEKMANTD